MFVDGTTTKRSNTFFPKMVSDTLDGYYHSDVCVYYVNFFEFGLN